MEILKCPSCKSGNVELIRIDSKDEGMKCKDCGAIVRWYSPIQQEAKSEIKEEFNNVRPIPCVRDEHGETKEQTIKNLFAKIDEELNELKDSVVYGVDSGRLLSVAKDKTFCPEYIAEEAADTITAITTMLEALGISSEMRDEAQRQVNRKNRKKGRL